MLLFATYHAKTSTPHIKNCVTKILLVVLLCAGSASAQSRVFHITNINFPTELCIPAEDLSVTVGFSPASTAVIFSQSSTLGRNERTFLPDGTPCGDYGCSYHAPVTFNIFGNNDTISSVEDINYVKINIEHSFIGDLYINITCPNGQKADILRYSGQGSSLCNSTIDSASRGWLPGYNVSVGSDLGYPNRTIGSPPCDSSVNPAGIGWNYCWSNRATAGYNYASGDGIIYRSRNNLRIDSTHLSTLSNFYHPDQSFASLIGCPLNGNWYIEVMDGWANDNGYIFNWELSLNPSLIPPDTCALLACNLTGPYSQRVNDSSFLIHWPQSITHDTIVNYTFTLISSCGTRDTTVSIHLLPASRTPIADTIWENQLPWTFSGTVFPYDTLHAILPFTGANGCDSIVDYSLHVLPGYFIEIDTFVCDNQFPIVWHGFTFQQPGSSIDTLQSIHRQDSIVRYTLHSLPSYRDTVKAGLCSYQYFIFEGDTLTQPGTYSYMLTSSTGCDSLRTLILNPQLTENADLYIDTCDSFTWFNISYWNDTVFTRPTGFNIYGCDSTTTLHLTLRHRSISYFYDTIVENDLPYIFLDRTFQHNTAYYPIHFTNAEACDSTLYFTLHVYWNVHLHLDTTLCNDQLPFSWQGILYDTIVQSTTTFTRVDSLRTVRGFDSIITARITILPVHKSTIDTCICDNQSYTFGNYTHTHSGHYHDTLQSQVGCDSIADIHLTVHPTYLQTDYDTICYDIIYPWHQNTISSNDTFLTQNYILHDTLLSVHQCDSVFVMYLTKMALPRLALDIGTDCANLEYILNAEAYAPFAPDSVPCSLPYRHWSSWPHDSLLVGQESHDTIHVSPQSTTVYTYTADYHAHGLCPVATSVAIAPVVIPVAQMVVSPSIIYLDNPYFTAKDITSPAPDERIWYIDNIQQYTTAPVLYGEIQTGLDSCTVTLKVSNGACRDSVRQTLRICQVGIVAPNVFTPSLESNNTFQLTTWGIIKGELSIYDRFGTLIFKTNDFSQAWDGTYNGQPCTQRTYVWKFHYRSIDQPDAFQIKTGTITLLR